MIEISLTAKMCSSVRTQAEVPTSHDKIEQFVVSIQHTQQPATSQHQLMQKTFFT